jgi:putative addiction module component (TIGR02574 family)
MQMTVKAIRDKALSLPIAQRISLVEDLWDSIAKDQKSLPLSDDHARIIDARLAADEATPRELVSWKDSVKEARRQVARKKKR